MDYQNKYSSLGPGFETENLKGNKGIPIPVILFLIVSVLLAGVSMGLFPKSFSEYKIFTEAEERTQSGDTSAALEDLYSVQEMHPNSLPVTLKLIDLSMENGYYDVAAHVFNEYLVGKELTDSQYFRMMSYSRRLDSYYLTYDALESLFPEIEAGTVYDDNGEVTEESMEHNTQLLRDAIRELHQDSEQYQAMLYYYDAMLCEDRREQHGYLQKAYNEDPELFDVRVLLGNAERSLGNLTEARSYLKTAIRKEAQDAGALRGLAVLAMLEGNPEEALTLARQAYESNPDGLYVRDTYLIALHINGDSGEQSMRDELEAVNGSLEEDTLQLLNGQITLEDYYMGD